MPSSFVPGIPFTTCRASARRSCRVFLAALLASLASMPASAQTVRVSVSSAGTQADGPSWGPAISETGRFVAFLSSATNLVAGDTNGVSDAFVHDRDADADGILDEPGAVRTERVSIATGGAQANGAAVTTVALSGDGQYVAFASEATNLVAGLVVSGRQVYRHDRLTRETICVSLSDTQSPAGGSHPSISRDGRHVAFLWGAIVVRDVEAGTLTGISPPLPDDQYWHSVRFNSITWRMDRPYISADGTRVAFTAVQDERTYQFVTRGFTSVYDRVTGAMVVNNAPGFAAGISEDGRAVGLVGGVTPTTQVGYLDTATATTVFALTGMPWPTMVMSGNGRRAVSRSSFGGALRYHLIDLRSRTSAPLPQGHLFPYDWDEDVLAQSALDRIGRFLAITTGSATLLPQDGDSNGAADVYVVDVDVAVDADGDGLDDRWEAMTGLSITSATGADGPAGDPDGDGRTNQQELEGGGHPRGFEVRLLAEGAQGSFFRTSIGVVNPGAAVATVAVRHLTDHGAMAGGIVTLPARSRSTVGPGDQPSGLGAFGTVLESDVPIVAERTMAWDGSGYGGHAASSAAASTSWWMAEGSTTAPFDLFYLLLNPGATAVTATVTYLRSGGLAPVTRQYALPPESRTTIHVGDDAAELADTDLAAAVTAIGPIVVERAMYYSAPGGPLWQAGHASEGVTAPSPVWYLPEGATGPFFDLFLLLANPAGQPVPVEVAYLTETGDTLTKSYVLRPLSRTTIWVNAEQFEGRGQALSRASVSMIVTSTGGVPVVAERSMWWPAGTTWTEGHHSVGSTETGTRWVIADARDGGPGNHRTYLLLTNPSAVPVDFRITLLRDTGQVHEQTVAVAPRRRTTIAVREVFHAVAQPLGGFAAIVERVGTSEGELVVEHATYWDAAGIAWAGGTSALATRVPD